MRASGPQAVADRRIGHEQRLEGRGRFGVAPQARSAISKSANCAAAMATDQQRAANTRSRGRRGTPGPRPRPPRPPGASCPGAAAARALQRRRDRRPGTGAGPFGGERRLARNRHRVMDQRLDAPALRCACSAARSRTEHREQVIDVPGIALGGTVTGAPAKRRRYSAAQARAARRSTAAASRAARSRIAACISSRREFTPNSP